MGSVAGEKQTTLNCGTAALLFLGAGFLVLALGVGAYIHLEVALVKTRVATLEKELAIIRPFLDQVEEDEERSRRHAAFEEDPAVKSFSEDGVPVRNKKYAAYKKDGQGFRVYNAWFQHRRENKIRNDPRVVVRHPTDAPIRAHHRKSAAWVNPSDDEDFRSFGDSLYKDTAPKRITILRSNSAHNSINHGKNRAKITNPNEYKVEEAHQQVVKTTPSPPVNSTTTSPLQLNMHMISRTNSSSSKYEQTGGVQQQSSRGEAEAVNVGGGSSRGGLDLLRGGRRGARNRAAVRSGGRGLGSRLRGRPGLRQSQGAIHVEGAGGVNAHQLTGSVFSHWKVARWAQKLRLENRFELKDGRITVASPGIYYLYAQINYLDESDVNGFQIYVNDSPIFLCTAMTHTPTATTKANTCYTGGVTFLEHGDQVFVKNLDENRSAVMLSAHSFFGLLQVSDTRAFEH